MKAGIVSTASAALVATVAGVGGTLPVVLAAAQPAPMSPLVASSTSLWLMPSLHGTNTMAVGATRDT